MSIQKPQFHPETSTAVDVAAIIDAASRGKWLTDAPSTMNDAERDQKRRDAIQTLIGQFGYDCEKFREFVFSPESERETAHFDITHCGSPIISVSHDDFVFVSELIRTDVGVADVGLLRRYIIETGTGKLLYDYRDYVAGGIMVYHKDRRDFNNVFVTSLIRSGHFHTYEQLSFCQMRILSQAGSAKEILNTDISTIEGTRRLIAARNCPSDCPVSDETIEAYRDINDHPLPGAFFENGTWTAKRADDGQQIDIKAQRNYVIYVMIPRARRKIVNILNTNITPEVLADTHPDTLAAINDLIRDLPYEEHASRLHCLMAHSASVSENHADATIA